MEESFSPIAEKIQSQEKINLDELLKTLKFRKIGDKYIGNTTILPVEQRPTILLLSDDMRVPTGVGTVSKSLILGTVHRFNWIQVAATIKHPQAGKIINLNKAAQIATAVPDAQVKLYATNGYGNPTIIRSILNHEKIDAIMCFTDPRFWDWLANMENEIRQNIPMIYYSLWDDLPYPKYNQSFYGSFDLIMSISKQSKNIHEQVLGEENYC